MKFFFDTSSLAKRYIFDEKGSDLVEKIFIQADAVIVSSTYFAELISALAWRRRQKLLSDSQYSQCKRSAIEDFVAFEVCPLSSEVLRKAVTILENSDLRALDAIQVASAIEAKASRFVSSDKKQISVAKQFGLKVEAV